MNYMDVESSFFQAELKKRYNEINAVIDSLKLNTTNKIKFRKNENIKSVTFSVLHQDIHRVANWIIHSVPKGSMVIFYGDTSYEQFVLDLTCLKFGRETLVLPKSMSLDELKSFLSLYNNPLLFCEDNLDTDLEHLTFESILQSASSLLPIYDSTEAAPIESGFYSACCSSGTTSISNSDTKIIRLPYFSFQKTTEAHYGNVSGGSILVWMSYSHFIQRVVAFEALALQFDLIISKPSYAYYDIKKFKPSFMVSAPHLYEMIANSILNRIEKLDRKNRRILRMSDMFLNHKSLNKFKKRFLSLYLSRSIPEISAFENADNFFWNGAPISIDSIKVLTRFGIQIYGAYGISEIGQISSDCMHTYSPGSVGVPSRTVKISEYGEILIKVDENVRTYDSLNLTTDNYIKTSDYGHISKGNLFVTSRKDDVIILGNGKNINPHEVETYFKRKLRTNYACLISGENEDLIIILNNEFGEYIPDIVRNYNYTQRVHASIRKVFLTKELNENSKYITSSKKLKRKLIKKHYVDRVIQGELLTIR